MRLISGSGVISVVSPIAMVVYDSRRSRLTLSVRWWCSYAERNAPSNKTSP